jgi:hypothetical protein
MKSDPRKRRPSKVWCKSWLVTKSEAKTLLADENWTRDPENDDLLLRTAYVSDRGELLLYYQRGHNILVASRNEYMERKSERSGRTGAYHMLEGRLHQGPHFIEAVPALIDELAGILKIPRESLDTSFESLHLVDAVLKKIRPREWILEIPNLYPGLIAYAGEVMRKETGGRWKLIEVHGGIFEPYIDFGPPSSQYVDPFSGIFWVIAWRHQRFSLAAIVANELPGMGAGISKAPG